MKLLLLGKDGQVGRALQPALAAVGELIACGRAQANLERVGELPRLIAAHRPDVIVNAAAYTAVDQAETDVERARLVNAEAVATLAAAAHRTGAWLVHYSTDYVFDGRQPEPYTEADTPAPLSVYGMTKHAGDLAIARTGCRHLIFRVSWVYAPRSNNFARAMLHLARDRTSLDVVADQFGAPTSAGLIASVTAAAIARAVGQPASDGLSGLYHLAPAGVVSRADYARFLIEAAHEAGAPLKLSAAGVRPIPTSDYPTPAARPLNSRLDTAKLRATFALALPPWQDAARRWVAETVAEGAY
jgi:dTDP-4-dehydrorhamnose reductase